MYNRYIGNTGKYYRVEDINDNINDNRNQPPASHRETVPPPPPPHRDKEEVKSDSKSFLKSFPEFSENLRHTVKDKMPAGIDIGDILLVLILLFLFLEEGDDEMLIVLVILIIMWVMPLFGKDKK